MIGVITYDAPHRKTQDLLYHLILNGYSNIHLIVIPWVQRENKFVPIYKHRPSKSIPVSIEELSTALKIGFTRVEIDEMESLLGEKEFEHIIIGGAGLLPGTLPRNFDIINAHPGYLPRVRGLDALKWAIYKGDPLGVTSHYISEEADEGRLIERREIPVYFEDSFHEVANRMYEVEIEMLVNAVKIIEKGDASLLDLKDERYQANRRMPHYLEPAMMERFDQLRKKSGSRRG